MIIEKLSNQTKPMIEAGSRSEDLKHYVDDCLLKVSKKIENNYEEVRNQLQQHETEFVKERKMLELKFENIASSKSTMTNCKKEKLLDSKISVNGDITNNNTNGAFRTVKINNQPSSVSCENDGMWKTLSDIYFAFSKFNTQYI